MGDTNWKKICNTNADDIFWIGTVFRLNAKYPYEKIVDFMLVQYPDAESGFALIVTSGHKSGLMVVVLPVESLYKSDAHVISAKWLMENWKKWVYEEGPEGVYYTNGYVVDQSWIP